MSDNDQILFVLNKLIYGVNFMTILGSLLTFIIFSRKAFEKSSISVYCKALAIFDLFVVFNLVSGLTSIISNISLNNDYDFFCKLIYFISTGISAIPGWILVAFSIDQLIIVCITDRFRFFKKRRFQYSLILGIAIFHCVLYSPVFFFTGVLNVTTENGTIKICQNSSFVMPILYLFESNIIPFTFIVVCTALIVRILFRSRKKIATELVVPRRRQVRDLKFAFNSVILNILFIVFIIPLILSYILPLDFSTFNFFNTVSFTLFYLNFALHFWIHLCFNSIFRKEFLILFRIIKR
jgi:hypothetical protein